jgi:hypothetical protein
MRLLLILAVVLGTSPLVGRAQEADSPQRATLRSSLTRADSLMALESYWMARRHAAGVAMASGGGLLLIGGVTTLATPNEGATVLRSGGILLVGAGAVLLPVSAVQRHRLRLSRLSDMLSGRKPVSPALWQRALEHRRRVGMPRD